MHDLLLDLRYALRLLAKSPVFTGVAVLTLGFGIGLNTTLFSVVNAVALRPVPVRDSGHVVRLERWFAKNRYGIHGNIQYAFSDPEFQYFVGHNHVFSSVIAASFPVRVAASLPFEDSTIRSHASAMGPPENAIVQMVSSNYLDDLEARLTIGRAFTAGDNRAPGANPVIVLSYPYRQTRFSGDPRVLRKIVKINDTSFSVIGVAAEQFVGTGNPPVVPDFWAPLSMQTAITRDQDWSTLPLDGSCRSWATSRQGCRGAALRRTSRCWSSCLPRTIQIPTARPRRSRSRM